VQPETADGQNSLDASDTASLTDSAIDVHTPSHSRNPSSAAKPPQNAPLPLLKEKNLAVILRSSDSSGVQFSRKRYATAKAAEVSRFFTKEKDQHIRSLARTLSVAEAVAKGCSSPETAAAAVALGKAYRDAGCYEEALQVYNEALTAREATLGAAHPTTLNVWDSVGQVYEIQSQWSDALACYQTVLEGRQQHPRLGQSHPSTLTAATNVGKMQKELGELTEAMAQFDAVLSTYEAQDKGASLPAIAVRLLVGQILESQGKLDIASGTYTLVQNQSRSVLGGQRLLEHATTALSRTQRVVDPGPDPSPFDEDLIARCHQQLKELDARLGRTHPDSLAKMYELAMAYSSNEQHRNALGWFQEVAGGRAQTFGPDHPLTLDAVCQQASAYMELDDFDKALEHHHVALIGRESRLGDDHPQTLASVVSVASVYSARGDLNVARDLLFRAVAGYDRRLGLDHSTTLAAKFKLAEVHREKALLQKALELHQEVLQRRTAALGASNGTTLNSERAVANVYRQMKQIEMAVRHYRRALQGREEAFGRVHSVTTSIALDLASLYWENNRPAEAVDFYRHVLEGLQHRNPKSQSTGIATMSNIALCYYTVEDYSQALTWYQKIRAIQVSESGPCDEHTVDVAEQIARCCMEIEDWTTAIDMFQVVIAIKEKTSKMDPSEWSFNMFQIALACFKKGMYDESLSWSSRIITLADKVRPEERLATMRRMAVIYTRQAKLDKALETYQAVVDECSGTLGEGHWLAQSALSEMARVHLEVINDVDGQRDFQKTLDEIQKRLDKDNFDSLTLLYRFADVHLERYRYQEALNLYNSVLDAVEHSSFQNEENFRALRNACCSDIATCHMRLFNNELALTFLDKLLYCGDEDYHLGALVRIGNTQEKQGDYLAAVETYKQLMEIEVAKVGAQPQDALLSQRKIAALYSRASRYQDALTCANKALAGFRSLGVAGVAETFETLDFLAGVYCHLGQFQEAMRVQKEAMDGFAQVKGSQHPLTLKATLDLAEMYRGLERKDDAKQLYERALKGYEARVREVRNEGNTEVEEQRLMRELNVKIREVGGTGCGA
jgi:tetratricopeptide (TPR) repeat protein